ncbi:hypothetical protein EZM97_08570 [Dyella soli]|uniref:Uncharacterized protein n=1 Tax=Dyella soli TaxID=522319 RepID=A0A4R0Z1N2_9GAMM|nr:hypothetical protein [Dyella soli]TCI13318.1 hypothetical protein EZM97_08570 [Dyella soli]
MDKDAYRQPSRRPSPEVERPVLRRIGRTGPADYDFAAIKIPDALDDGTLPQPYVDQDVETRIPLWMELPIHVNDKYFVTIDGKQVGDRGIITQEIIDRAEDLSVKIDKKEFAGPDRTYQVSYAVAVFPGGDIFDSKHPFALRIDRTAPGGEGLGEIDFPNDIEDHGLTSERLDELGDVLEGAIPDYFDRMIGDVIQPYLGDDIPVDPIKITAVNIDQFPVARFTRKHLLDAGGKGIVKFYYRVTDRAGNISQRSTETRLRLFLVDEPINLTAPGIAAMHDGSTPGVIVEKEARDGVAVSIPQYTHVAPGDEIILDWAGVRLPPVTVRASDIKPGEPATPLFYIIASYADIQAANEQSRYAAEVMYIVRRGREIMSESTLVVVNLSIPGGPDPDPGTPINENLHAPRVRGKASGQDNNLTPEDSIAGANVFIRTTTTEMPPSVAFAKDDVIQLSWHGSPAGAPYVVREDDIGGDIVIEVDADTIGLGGSGLIEVQYKATRNNEPDPGSNTALSPVQGVRVTLKGDLPGGGKLDVGLFTEANENNAIGYAAANSDGGTPFVMPHYRNKKPGDILFVHFVGNDRLDGSGKIIEGSRFTHTHFVSGNDADTASTVVIPTVHLLEIEYGSAHAYYTASNEYGVVRADDAFVYMDTRHGSNDLPPSVKAFA